MALLSEEQIKHELTTVPGWNRDGDSIVTSVEAESFLLALDLVVAAGGMAEKADHHPDIDIRWRTVTFTLSTHSEGGLTDQDFGLARKIDELMA